jgi:hypothetical protein
VGRIGDGAAAVLNLTFSGLKEQDMNGSWLSRVQRFLQEKADKAFADWRKTPAGRKWNERKGSPYKFGFSLPDWHHDLIRHANRGDEVEAKRIMLDNL